MCRWLKVTSGAVDTASVTSGEVDTASVSSPDVSTSGIEPEPPSGPRATCLSLAELRKKKPQAYGTWETIEAGPSLDLGLPEEEVVKEEPKVKPKEELRLKFVEKKVESLRAPLEGTVVTFKKRKTNSGTARSIKRRECD
ncbi:hypothetical protein NP493_1473g00002 [Ridgeia piscesae]|uniref:Uncharacterized protein n=1 Tax=Ridgeia piscesae TaxID=27915 RepID=A0AAD9K1P2_RIDPI|nr:hypothetical protein NP493_1473g00002 [Ridgeia piscesae]